MMQSSHKEKNPYMEMGFFRLGVIAFWSGLLFPWYLLYRAYSRGWKDTLYLVEALFHDWLSGIVYLVVALVALFVALLVLFFWGISLLF